MSTITISDPNIGLRFYRLTILSYEKKDKHGNIYYNCLCICGVIKKISLGHLRSGHTKSCGCLNIEEKVNRANHGHSRRIEPVSPEYKAWQNMKNRCYNINLNSYADYGGRGIVVCQRWKGSFENFFADMGKRPSPKHSLDRFPNNDGNYELGNVRWATKKEQQQNTRRNKWFEYEGKNMVASDWAKEFGIGFSGLWHHLKTKSFEETATFFDKKQ